MCARQICGQNNPVHHVDNTVACIDVDIDDFRLLIAGISSTLLKDHIAHAYRPCIFPICHCDLLRAIQVSAIVHSVLDRVIQQDELEILGTVEDFLRKACAEQFECVIVRCKERPIF